MPNIPLVPHHLDIRTGYCTMFHFPMTSFCKRFGWIRIGVYLFIVPKQFLFIIFFSMFLGSLARFHEIFGSLLQHITIFFSGVGSTSFKRPAPSIICGVQWPPYLVSQAAREWIVHFRKATHAEVKHLVLYPATLPIGPNFIEIFLYW